MPRSQVRSDPAEGLLQATSRFCGFRTRRSSRSRASPPRRFDLPSNSGEWRRLHHLRNWRPGRSRANPQVESLDAEMKALRRDLDDAPRLTNALTSPSNGYHSSNHPTPDALAWVQIDLGQSRPIDLIRVIPPGPPISPIRRASGSPQNSRSRQATTANSRSPKFWPKWNDLMARTSPIDPG